MSYQRSPGLGEALRQLLEMTDADMDDWYKQLPFPYRARYTPILRELASGPKIVSALTENLALTQGAVSQSLRLMLDDGLIEKQSGEDARQSVISLSRQGEQALEVLQPHWLGVLSAVGQLEKEIRIPLRDTLRKARIALAEQSFAQRVEQSKKIAGETTAVNTENPFSIASEDYRNYRPSYPDQLGETLANLCQQRDVVIDVGCGSGQLSEVLAKYFKQVIALDNSAEQISSAFSRNNIQYQLGSAERLSVGDRCADLIVAAQAAHWFDLERFYQEVRRVAKPHALLALISYGVPYIDDPVNAVFQQGYWQDCFGFWPEQRRPVEDGYSNLYFPFDEIVLPNVSIEMSMSFEALLGYISTWSAYKAAAKRNELAIFHDWFKRLGQHWNAGEEKKIVWPIAARVGTL
ncbi:methyltransferase domain-containing protein [Pseudoteredinibacter isoporae]|uniref:SAM-dependent methyltransferase n=1 Tax=Pseudoteredinibacter isoporae TaxID=570281 RepID=A0A7X0JPL3_9GAMM|nr:methyltransferase domain-containing protein [Pseudoteredinibacter isoporae]MBB6519939.1 SAM-dependent methyltransferase [Pseudoteredinibacter isoporae]NHO85514.1 methyltransferase domain-containing protein [Pseudoteredinibacter isoporae]NIB26034.1 methyltransferase domain-containing protein [Pseudoteredinibacter isoporae]